MDTLHAYGCVIYKNAVTIDPQMRTAIESMVCGANHQKPKVIFNNKKRGGDKKRLQMPLTETNGPLFAGILYKHIMEFAERNFPKLIPSNMVILTSKPGCSEQLPHCDYEPTYEFAKASDAEIPLGCLIAIEDNTKLVIWPYSIKLSCMPLHLSDEWIKVNGPIAKTEVILQRGDVLVFRGDLIHAGAAYQTNNTRIHVFLDSPVVERQKNRTWYPEESWIA
jgi:hypothetical protein